LGLLEQPRDRLHARERSHGMGQQRDDPTDDGVILRAGPDVGEPCSAGDVHLVQVLVPRSRCLTSSRHRNECRPLRRNRHLWGRNRPPSRRLTGMEGQRQWISSIEAVPDRVSPSIRTLTSMRNPNRIVLWEEETIMKKLAFLIAFASLWLGAATLHSQDIVLTAPDSLLMEGGEYTPTANGGPFTAMTTGSTVTGASSAGVRKSMFSLFSTNPTDEDSSALDIQVIQRSHDTGLARTGISVTS